MVKLDIFILTFKITVSNFRVRKKHGLREDKPWVKKLGMDVNPGRLNGIICLRRIFFFLQSADKSSGRILGR